jgi:6-pyruvoyltetrahydropterin/6-carboxytetrahydropterin synthase
MNNVRLTKQFHFEMAHALYDYDGPCKNLHGHSYQLNLCVIGKPIAKQNIKQGMVIDFTNLKQLVKPIIDELDHATMLNKDSLKILNESTNTLFGKLIEVDYQPTCENILIHLAERIQLLLPLEIKLHHLLLRETSSSFAEWYASDNE